MNEKIKKNFQELKQEVESNKALKTAVYVGIGVLSLYLLGKAFKALALYRYFPLIADFNSLNPRTIDAKPLNAFPSRYRDNTPMPT